MTDAIVLTTVILFAIATLPDGLSQIPFLCFTCRLSLLFIIVEAALALTDSWLACKSSFEAHAVKLATVTTLTVAPPILLT